MLQRHEYGPRDGTPVLYLHGTPGTGREAAVLHGAARDAGVRLVAPDRPGMGGSPGTPVRRLADWPADVEGLADALGLERFAVLGWSGGGPYALATLAALPEPEVEAEVAETKAPARPARTARAAPVETPAAEAPKPAAASRRGRF